MAFKRLDPEDFVVSSDSVTSTVWSNNSPSLNTYYSSSIQKEGSSGPFYISVYNTGALDSTSEVQFQIAYGNKNGGGGVDYDGAVPNVSPTSTIYGQYRALVLEDENSQFVWGSSFTGSDDNDFYAISIERARYKQTLLPGSTNIVLSSSGDNAILHLTDNSNMVSIPDFYGTTRVYQLISGSNGTSYDGGTGYTTNSGSYGWFLPDIATILLNPYALADVNGQGIGMVTEDANNTNAQNPATLYNVFTGSSVLTSIDDVFRLNSQETLTSDYVFIRTRNSEFNYSENPTFISGSTGEVIYTYFINNPTVYPTTIGMYNDSNELLAVAKLSKPLQKDFTKEALVRVKLDF
tara:strand:- start:3739 stop:4788 length:1050 start_codon:yes stop_codon:yes gene_type:complete